MADKETSANEQSSALPQIVTTLTTPDGDHASNEATSQPVASSNNPPSTPPTTAHKSHRRTDSLQVPGASDAVPLPSSPTMSVQSDISASADSMGSIATPQRTTLALRDNDPSAARHPHLRQASIASVMTDISGEGKGLPAPLSATTVPEEPAKFPLTGDEKDGRNNKESTASSQPSPISPDSAGEGEKKPLSRWAQLRANVKGATRQGRRDAQALEMAAEKKRMREMDPTPFRLRPIELADLVDPKNVEKLRSFGGVKGLLAALGTDSERGLELIAPSSEAHVDEKRELAATNEDDIESRGQKSQEEQSHPFIHASPEDRERVYGRNVLPEKKSKSLLLLMWLALQDKILILLCIAAVVSLALGLYQRFGADPELVPCNDPPPGFEECPIESYDWVEGVAILVAVAIVDIVGSLNDWQKERQFRKLNAKKEERDVKVIRSGKRALISVHHVQVGDILELEPGEILPCDGVFLRGHNVKCDESGATGESDMIRKVSYEDCLADWEKHEKTGAKLPHRDCFLLSGSRCLEGVGEYVVIAVGPFSFNGKLMMSLRSDGEITPLQAKLNRLAEIIAYAGTTAGVLLFVALMIKFFVQLARPRPTSPRTADEKAQTFIDILISAVVIIVVAVPEGLPLATTLALAFATKRMTKENLLVRLLSACETSANCSVICTDKTGTLTQNEMTVVAGSVGARLKFARDLEENKGRIEDVKTDGQDAGDKDWAIEQRELNKVVDGPLRQLFNDAIAVNSTAFEEDEKAKSIREKSKERSYWTRFLPSLSSKKEKEAEQANSSSGSFVGSKTETALLKMAKELEWQDYRESRSRNEVLNNYPFSSERKAMAVVVRKPDGGCRVFVKGASEVLTKICSAYVDVRPNGDASGDVQVTPFNEDTRQNVAKTIIFYANQMLRTLAICYRDYPSWPPPEAQVDEDGAVTYESIAHDLTLISIVGIEDPLRSGVRNAVATCAKAGVQVKMCTGDNALTARSIATQCGIFTSGGLIMEGPTFRLLNDVDMMMIVPRLQVLARCSPEDKKILVECLKRLDHVVGVTGDGTNDAPALKTANVGFSMGIAGTEVAREASDIILMDDNFESIVTAIMWGRCVNDAVKRFLQFQLSVNIGAVGITFISAVASEEEKAVFTAVQLLWINLIMDTLAALALATDPATPDSLKRKPDRRDAPLLSTDMWKMIIGQSIYQFALILTFNFAGHKLLGEPLVEGDVVLNRMRETELRALIFNLYVWCQLFNQINCRSLTRELNIFKGLHRNFWFMGIILIEVALQIIISYKGGMAFSVVPLKARDWGICIIGGLISLPIGVLIRLIPTEPIDQLLIRLGLMPDPKALPSHRRRSPTQVEADAEKVDWDEPVLGQLAQKLGAFARVRGGRSRLAFSGKQRRDQRLRERDIHPGNLMALVPAMIGAGIVGNWHPTNPPEASRSEPAAGDPSLSSWQLFEGGKIQVHPETDEGDDFIAQLKDGHLPPFHQKLK